MHGFAAIWWFMKECKTVLKNQMLCEHEALAGIKQNIAGNVVLAKYIIISWTKEGVKADYYYYI